MRRPLPRFRSRRFTEPVLDDPEAGIHPKIAQQLGSIFQNELCKKCGQPYKDHGVTEQACNMFRPPD